MLAYVAGDGAKASDLASKLNNNNNKFFIPAGSCLRTICKDTTAIYVCNVSTAQNQWCFVKCCST